MSQHMEALERANLIRLGRAQIAREIKNGVTTVRDVLETKPFVCDTMTIYKLLTAQTRWGRKRTRKFLCGVGISENVRVGNLTYRQNQLIRNTLEE